ncbi:LysR substrate-binding domain-containing protein [Pantoea stewartii]|uniref:LysR substrate-binding domain-containing protein n=1 Tax=Pantoea stewartii TaxID=66269 RepID=UPI00138FDAC6|nr:LysR substrate-binding domain-containing protein [Pantoea stewartii]UYK99781.1 LysR substrate-binding domain-containing protein [Pantoea stewartii]
MAKRPVTFDAESLRTFVTGIELGSFASAAQRLGRSTSAVSAQLKKLEYQAGAALVQKSGRHLTLTAQGEIMLAYARRLMSLNDEACAAIKASGIGGEVRLGLQEDFGETLLPAVLGQFSRAHPDVQISASVSRNQPLLTAIRQHEIDVALCWQGEESTAHSQSLGALPLNWISVKGFDVQSLLDAKQPLPLLVFDAPCLMRSAATAALDRANIPWRIAFTSRSLSGIWAAAEAGLGITLRTQMGLPSSLTLLTSALPEMGTIGVSLHCAEKPLSPAAASLCESIKAHFAGL